MKWTCKMWRPFWVFLVNEKRSLSEPEKLKRAVPKDKNSPKGQQSSTWGTKKQYCTLPRDTKICLFPRDEKKEKFEQQKQIWKKNWPWQKKACKNMKKTMKKWIRGPKSLSPGSFPFSPSQLPITKFYLVLNPFTLSPFLLIGLIFLIIWLIFT